MPPKFATNHIEKSSATELTLEEYKKQGEDFVNSHKRLFSSFAEDVSLKFRMADKFQIDYENGIVQLDSNWFFDRGYNKEQILWAVFHELSHFRDFANDKTGLLDSFTYIKGKAEKLTEETGMDPGLAYKTYHTLFNCLDDIYVNKTVSRRASYFETKRQGGKHVENLYKEKLFKDTDFTKTDEDGEPLVKIPHHLQFAFYLLRKAMLPNQDIVVSDEVRGALDNKFLVGDKEHTVESLINAYMVPSKSKDTKASARHSYLKTYIEPIYEALIQKDLQEKSENENNEQNNQNSGPGEQSSGPQEGEKDGNKTNQSESGPEKGKQGENSSQTKSEPKESQDGESTSNSTEPSPAETNEGDQASTKNEQQEQKFKDWADIHSEFESKSPDQLSEDDIKKFTEYREEKKEEQKIKETEPKSPQSERTVQVNLDKNWAEENKTEGRDLLKELQSLREIEDSIMPYLDSLTELWQNIIAGKSIGIDYVKDRFHSSGPELNIDSVVDNMGAIYAHQSAPRIYDKVVTKETIIEKPEIIRIRLVADKSGSMENEIKQRVLAQTLVLILRSLQQFNEMLNLTRGSTGSKLKVETQVLGFSDSLSIIKKLDSEAGEVDPTLEILNTLKRCRNERGSTYDDLALNHVTKNQSEIDVQRIKQGKILDILFEITDGGSSNQESSKKAVTDLDITGIHTNAFQIGKVEESEKRAFNYVWNSGENKKGLVVGEDIEKLLPAITEALRRYLANVQL